MPTARNNPQPAQEISPDVLAALSTVVATIRGDENKSEAERETLVSALLSQSNVTTEQIESAEHARHASESFGAFDKRLVETRDVNAATAVHEFVYDTLGAFLRDNVAAEGKLGKHTVRIETVQGEVSLSLRPPAAK